VTSNQLSITIILFFFSGFFSLDIFSFTVVNIVSTIIIYLIYNTWGFTNSLKLIVPKFKYFSQTELKNLVSLGLKFFILQLCTLVLFSSDNFIINHYLGAKEVVKYKIAYKYFGLISSLQIAVLTPFWSASTKAYKNQENNWIKKQLRKLNIFSFILIMVLFIMFFLAPYFFDFWTNSKVEVPSRMSILMILLYAILILFTPYNYFINGTGKLQIHLIGFIVSALLNILLSILFVKYFTMGVEGVITATIISILPYIIIFPLQTKKLLNGTAVGAWDK